MANMSFGVNIIPKQNNTYTLGNSDYKWNIFANTINGQSIDDLGLPTVSSTDNGKILQVSSGTWAAVSSPDLSIYATKADPEFTGTINFGRATNSTVGTSSVAIGYGVTASGHYSFAEGSSTIASGQSSHAEGYGTQASGISSHAEGTSGTVGSGTSAYRAQALGDYSHTEGSYTYASGQGSHAEGGTTKATEAYAHAEGYTTQANGQGSHAEGTDTIANSNYSHAEGMGGSIVVNNVTRISGAYANAAHSEGLQTRAEGHSSHSEGGYTYAKMNYSHAEGFYSEALEYYAHVEGYYNTTNGEASHAEGGYCTITANGKYGHAEGEDTDVSARGAHAEGYNTTASATYTHAEGYQTTASGTSAHAEGLSTSATESGTHAEGASTSATAYEAHAEGYYTTASAFATHAEGYYTTASGTKSHSEGEYTTAANNASHAEGVGGTYYISSNAYPSGAYAEGAHSEGYQTIAGDSNAVAAHAEGYQTRALGSMGSHAEGCGGSFTIGSNSYLSGALSVSAHSEGYRTLASMGAGAHSEGQFTVASAMATHSEGVETIASGMFAHSEGQSTQAQGMGSHSQGKGTIAYGGYSDVIGRYNIIDSSYTNWNEWAANTSYSIGDKVKYTTGNNVSAYICITANNDSSFTSSKWESTTITNYITIAGNGTNDSNRSNAYALDWDGNAFFKGNVYVGANADSSGGSKLATEAYVTTAIANAGGGSGSSTPSNLATVATTGDYGDLINKPDLSQYITAVPAMTGCSSSAAGASGLVPAPAAGNEDQFLSGDGTWKSGGLPMVILSYGNSTWAQFEAAYKNNVIVYCRASSNSNPASGSQTRMAFMAYVNDATNPANVEFQYYRSVNTHSSTQMGDQVFVYKLDKTSGWSVTTREASIKQISIDTNNAGSVAWSSNKVTLTTGLPKVSASDNGKILQVVNGVWTAVTPS